ncbi:MAG: hypothetical protein WDW36_000152 [Sanguina aurantia]
MNRREFLLAAASAAVALPTLSFSSKLFAAPASAPRFLMVFLRGGYDSNNLLVPYSSDFYYEARPTLAIARPDAGNPDSAIALDGNWGLNPVLRDSIYPLWQRKQIAFVPFAGTDDLSRSHFETQDNIERGQAIGSTGNFRSGFMARLSGQLATVPTIAFTNDLPLSLQGASKDVPNISLLAKRRRWGSTPACTQPPSHTVGSDDDSRCETILETPNTRLETLLDTSETTMAVPQHAAGNL